MVLEWSEGLTMVDVDVQTPVRFASGYYGKEAGRQIRSVLQEVLQRRSQDYLGVQPWKTALKENFWRLSYRVRWMLCWRKSVAGFPQEALQRLSSRMVCKWIHKRILWMSCLKVFSEDWLSMVTWYGHSILLWTFNFCWSSFIIIIFEVQYRKIEVNKKKYKSSSMDHSKTAFSFWLARCSIFFRNLNMKAPKLKLLPASLGDTLFRHCS